jgi:phosphate:Na+ symporter
LALSNRLKAVLVGAGVTAVLQSSTATGLVVASFAASGLVSLVPALAVMLGANVGTTLIVQVLSFDIGRITPLLVLLGVVLFRRGGQSRTRDLGRVAIGLGLMLMALAQLLQVITPYEDVPSLRILLGAIATDPLIDILVGAALTWAAHSSVAVVLLVMSFTAKGVVPLTAGMALVLGANLGSALNPVLEGAQNGDVAGRRVALGNLLNRVVGCTIVLPCLPWLGAALVRLEPDLSRALADFHTLFNAGLALLFLPLLSPFASLMGRLMPERVTVPDPSRPAYLDASALQVPPLALAAAGREALRMADVLAEMVGGAADVIERGDRGRISGARQMDDVLDRLNAAIKAYVTQLDPEALSDVDEERVRAILAFTTHLEHAGDIIDRSLMPLAAKRLKRGLAFSEEGEAEIRALLERIGANLRSAGSVFMSADVRAARLLAAEKASFRNLVQLQRTCWCNGSRGSHLKC